MLSRAPQQHLDASQQVVDVEWLGDEVVGPELEAQELVTSALGAATDEDGHVGHLFEDAAQHQPVLVGQDQVEDDQVRLDMLEHAARSGASRRLAD